MATTNIETTLTHHDPTISLNGSEIPGTTSPLPIAMCSKKRKRETVSVEELEIDISAPEPPSKKALRSAKKGKIVGPSKAGKAATHAVKSDSEPEQVKPEEPAARSEYGVWIGNLPFTTTKPDILRFLTDNTSIAEESITRLNMPAPTDLNGPASRQWKKPINKGFAYVDFLSSEALSEALALSEKLLMGRRLLIKNSKSFEGRPAKAKNAATEESVSKSGKAPSKRIFVGNLSFDTSKEDLEEHFAPCGKVLDVHIATFEDSGKCKGYAWVEFDDVEAGEAAVRGWVKFPTNKDSSLDSEGDEVDPESGKIGIDARSKAIPKLRKWWMNKMKGRPLRMEFAEDKAARYKKRFGKEGTSQKNNAGGSEGAGEGNTAEGEVAIEAVDRAPRGKAGSTIRRIDPPVRQKNSVKVDARTIRPGAALANAQRMTGAIVASQGTKKTFA
ncbi:hypothetical protein MMC16_004705 [Acarospora aff. strigata]|nr:hypothetical protein [Acarospora aff. strigata]